MSSRTSFTAELNVNSRPSWEKRGHSGLTVVQEKKNPNRSSMKAVLSSWEKIFTVCGKLISQNKHLCVICGTVTPNHLCFGKQCLFFPDVISFGEYDGLEVRTVTYGSDYLHLSARQLFGAGSFPFVSLLPPRSQQPNFFFSTPEFSELSSDMLYFSLFSLETVCSALSAPCKNWRAGGAAAQCPPEVIFATLRCPKCERFPYTSGFAWSCWQWYF